MSSANLVNINNSFKLNPAFVAEYAKKQAPFGFNGLGELVYLRTYSRIKPDGSKEKWHETVERVVNGTYNMQKRWIESHSLGWDEDMAHDSAEEMYDRIWNLKFCPPGRGLWAMGSPVVDERGLYASLNNCAFVSTENLAEDGSKPFLFMMDMSMLGCGIGFDTKGAGQITIKQPEEDYAEEFTIPDSREGWVEALRLLLDSYFEEDHPKYEFDYSLIRPAGEIIRGFGGISSGHGPLKDMMEKIESILSSNVGKAITVTMITDIMNLIGVCVVAGGVRRTAEIAFGDYNSEEFVNLKNYEVNPERASYGWASNNSIFADIGMDYNKITRQIALNGEPGLAWLDNMRDYSRMNGVVDRKDHRVKGGNPCLEQSLESYELCCLVETFPNRCTDLEDFLRTLKFAYLYAKTVTLGKTHWAETNRVLLRNRRIGCSLSGVTQFLAKYDIERLREWCEQGYETIHHYDEMYSNWLCIPRSIKTTSIKPSGTVSLLAGATPGLHYAESRFYIRRMRLANTSDLVQKLRDSGYHVEPSVTCNYTSIVSIPVDVGEGVRTIAEVTMWEQLSLASFLQRHWADNQVSCTITFDRATEGPHIANALNYFQYQLKGVSFLPKLDKMSYPQLPYEAIDETTYKEMLSKITNTEFSDKEEAVPERFCDGESCTLK